ncbi:MAG: DUF1631 family protein [Proteobacteria bacterium]|nr:DUF1631 family protein [Pseudomonadota bacterium]
MAHPFPTDDKSTSMAAALLADCRARFLRTLRQAASEVIRHQVWLDELAKAAGECFDELSGSKERQGFEQMRSLTASSISLVHDDDMDYSVELMNLDQRLRDGCERELAALHLRMRILLSGTDAVLHKESPVGTESVCRALRALKEAERLSAAEAMMILERLEEPLQRHLCAFYRDLERDLAAAGVNSSYRIVTPSRSALGPGNERADEVAAPLPIDPVDALRLSVLARRDMAPGVAHLDPTLASALLERIEAWLSERQNYGNGVPQSLGTSELGALLAPAKAASVEVVETVFNYVAALPALPATIRMILAQLRVTMLRLALRSESLLAAERHPALRLVDLIANVGRTLPQDCPADLPVCRGLLLVVRPLLRVPRIEDRDFQVALSGVEVLLRSRQKGAVARAAALKDEAERLERREVALHQASRAIYLLIGHRAEPVVRAFIEGYWVHVLAKAAYRYGTGSTQWTSRVQTAHRLLVSAMPEPDEVARQQLMVQLPALMRSLEEGLAWIGLSPEHIREGLAPCIELHAALISGRPGPEPRYRRPSMPVLGPVGERPDFRILRHKQYFDGELSLSAEWAELEVGDCVAVGLPNGGQMRGFVGLIGPARQLILIADGDGSAVLAVTARALAQQATSPQTQLFRDRSIVDEAATDRLVNP